MTDPVVADDGHTYERSAIEQWFKDHNTSPVTRECVSNRLVNNYAIRSQLLEAGFPVAKPVANRPVYVKPVSVRPVRPFKRHFNIGEFIKELEAIEMRYED